MNPLRRGIVNSLIWIVSGIIVVIIRTIINPGASILVWETLGFGMIAYGTSKLLWVLMKNVYLTGPPESSKVSP